MEKVLLADIEKCTGCQVCEIVCSMTHSQGECNPNNSFIKIMKNDDFGIDIPVLSLKCDLCGKCVEFCMPQALKFVSTEEALVIRKITKIGEIMVPHARL